MGRGYASLILLTVDLLKVPVASRCHYLENQLHKMMLEADV